MPIVAVVAIYGQAPAETPTLRSLLSILAANPWMAHRFRLVLYDNSPEPQPPPAGIGALLAADMVHDRANGGLAAAYRCALEIAGREGSPWLLLLDQDTSLTRGFLEELLSLSVSLEGEEKIAAIVPKLLVAGEVYSPTVHFLDILRHPFTRTFSVAGREDTGLCRGRAVAYNSAALLRVAALRAIGGFPREFWLDFLDQAVFDALGRAGGGIYLMRACLDHGFSHSDHDQVPLWRHLNVLAAQTLFVRRSGNFFDRLLFRLWLLRHSRYLRRECANPRVWRATLRQAFLLRSRADAGPGSV